MNPDELAETEAELDAFVEDVFASLPRADQRGKGNLYLRGLKLDGRRKSMQPMGTRLGVDYQQLQQFVSSSPWKVEPVRRVLVRRALQLINPDAWVVDDTGFKKDGSSSPCVAWQYSGTLGKIGNFQIGVSIHAATDQASCPLDWRLYVPGAWDDTCADTNEEAELIAARRAKAQLPEVQRHRTKWAMALEMIDELAAWGHRPPALVADVGYGEITAFRCGLTERHIPYMVAVKASTSAFGDGAATDVLDYCGRGPRPHQRRYLATPSSLKDLVMNAGRPSLHQVTWRHGTKATPNNTLASMKSRFIALRVRPANRDLPRGGDGSLPIEWLLAEWPTGGCGPDRLLALHPAGIDPAERTRPTGQNQVAHRARLPGTENRSRPRPLRRPHLRWMAPPHDSRDRRPPLHHPAAADPPKSGWGSLSLYGILRELQRVLAAYLGYCPHCRQRAPT